MSLVEPIQNQAAPGQDPARTTSTPWPARCGGVLPSTRRFDLMVKWSRYQEAGCPSYWVVDPDTPSLIAWELRDGAYAQVAKVTGDESVRLTSPFEVTVVPADLIS
jgi:hypothetical protein